MPARIRKTEPRAVPFYIALAAVLMFFCTSQSVHADISNLQWLEFKDETNGVSFQYPSNSRVFNRVTEWEFFLGEPPPEPSSTKGRGSMTYTPDAGTGGMKMYSIPDYGSGESAEIGDSVLRKWITINNHKIFLLRKIALDQNPGISSYSYDYYFKTKNNKIAHIWIGLFHNEDVDILEHIINSLNF